MKVIITAHQFFVLLIFYSVLLFIKKIWQIKRYVAGRVAQ